MMSGIEKRFFEGGDNGKTPKYSVTDMDKQNFRYVIKNLYCNYSVTFYCIHNPC